MKAPAPDSFAAKITPDAARRLKAYLDERIRLEDEAMARQANADPHTGVAR